MVQLRLPKNARMQHGKVWPKPTTDPKTHKTLRIWRWNPDDQENLRIDVYTIDTKDYGPIVLDAIIHIKNTIEPICPSDGPAGKASANLAPHHHELRQNMPKRPQPSKSHRTNQENHAGQKGLIHPHPGLVRIRHKEDCHVHSNRSYPKSENPKVPARTGFA